MTQTLIRVLWTVFFAYWFYSARKTKQTRIPENKAARIFHLTIMISGFVLVLAGDWLPAFLKQKIVWLGTPQALAGILITTAGVVFAIWARITLGRNWSGAVTLKTDHQLVKTGPYQLVRHPIYTAILTMLLGSAISSGELRGLIAVLLPFFAYLIKIEKEETLLTKHFPIEYPQYQARTRKLIPFVY